MLLALESIGDNDAARVGRKALQLARLVRGEFRVPAGFCLAAAAYREHLESNGLASRVRATLEELADAAPRDRQAVLGELRDAIVRAPLADGVREAIENACRSLSERASGLRHPSFAVRSSATAEDLPEHSFAGLHDTYLGVVDPEACLEAVKKCWASLWSERAFEYRRRNTIDHESVDMAVIIQELVPADAAGVVFTADPVSGREDRLIMEATFGLGELLVSGRIAPDRIVLSKNGLAIVERSTATKSTQAVVDASGTLGERAVPEDRANTPSVDDESAVEVARLAIAVEDAFGFPVDVEWALAGGEAFLLQARAITTRTSERSEDSPESRQVWTNANTGEVVPDVVTPMTWSVLKPLVDKLMGTIFAAQGLNLGDHSLMGLVAGRVYFNLNTALGCLGLIPGVDARRKVADLFGGHQELFPEEAKIADDDIPDIEFSLLKCLLRLPFFLLRFLTCTPGKVDRILERMLRETREGLAVELDECSDAELVSLLRSSYRMLLESTESFLLFGIVLTYQALLYELCGRWLGESGKVGASRLLAGLGTNDNANAGLELWRLAVRARSDPDLETAVLAGTDFKSLREAVESTEAGIEFLEEWKGFTTRHGHHCRGEIELFNPRWSETPDELLVQLRSYVRASGEEDFLARYEGLEADRAEAEKACRRKLRNPLKRLAFAVVLRKAQRHAAVRENVKSEIVRRLAAVRLMLLELGERLTRRGILSDRDEVFFLELDELESVLRPEKPVELAEKIRVRRSEYESNLVLTPPPVVVGRFDPERHVSAAVDTTTSTFKGIAVHPGVVTGPARVILRAGSDEVLPGEILVAPFTDPGWTPYFLNAAAIVMDLGGLLSHGSIIAREYGIPSVVNVGPATEIIRTGQTLRVDGTRGTVEILDGGDG